MQAPNRAVRLCLLVALAATLAACSASTNMGIRGGDSGTGTNASNYGADNGFDRSWNSDGSVRTNESRSPAGE